jgi:flagellin-like protein
MILRNKKALSPVVSAIILIAVTVAVAIAATTWLGSISFSFMKTEEVYVIDQAWGSDISYVDLSVRNVGTDPVKISSIQVNKEVITNISYETGSETISAGESAVIRVYYNFVSGTKYELSIATATGNKFSCIASPSPGSITSWLSGWNKRVKITINSNDIDSELTDFPVLVHLSTSSGENNDDVSFIFDELGGNSKKIAVTTADYVTQCYVEVENWNDANQQAWLWVKVPNISDISNTEFYLYYDAAHSDNTNFIGDTGSDIAENVWDSNFVLVWHMSEEDDVIDSTQNNNDGTVTGLTSVVGKIGQAKNSNGGSNGIESTNDLTLGTGQFTIEGWFNPNVYTNGWIGLFGPKDPTVAYNEMMWPYQGKWGYWDWTESITTNQPIVAGQWDYYTVVREGTGSNQLANYINGLYINAGTSTRDFPDQPVWLGKSSTYPWNGISDELRISNTSRSAAWIKASYESSRDSTLTFGSEETA